MGGNGLFGEKGAFGNRSDFVRSGLRAATSSALTQGIGVATGLQSKFDFVGIAAASAGAGAGSFIGARTRGLGPFGSDTLANTAAAMANAATRSAINGSSFGDNLMRALPNAIGQTIGRALGNVANQAIAKASETSQKASHAPVSNDVTEVGDGAEIVVTANIQPGWAVEYLRALNSVQGQQARAEAYESLKRELGEGRDAPGVSTVPKNGTSTIAEGSGNLPGGRISSAQSWADYLVLTDSSVDIDGFLERNAGIYGSMTGQGLGRAIFLSGNDGQVRRQILPLLNTLASDSSNGGGFGQAFYQDVISEISTMLAAVDARAAPGLAQVERFGGAGLSAMGAPLIAVEMAGASALGYIGAGLQTNRTVQAFYSAGSGMDRNSLIGSVVGEDILSYGEMAFGLYAFASGGRATISNLAVESRVLNLTERGTLTNLFPEDAALLQGRARTLVQDDAGRYWLQSGGKKITPSGSYDFVTLPDGTVRVARTNPSSEFSTHLGLSSGGEVSYAGTIRFANRNTATRGSIRSWSNDSGHYQPPSWLGGNSNLPPDLFLPR